MVMYTDKDVLRYWMVRFGNAAEHEVFETIMNTLFKLIFLMINFNTMGRVYTDALYVQIYVARNIESPMG